MHKLTLAVISTGIVVTALTLSACSKSTPDLGAQIVEQQVGAQAAADQASAAQQESSQSSAAASAVAPDPCKVLTKADLQPFFLGQITTELPLYELSTEQDGKACQWTDVSGSTITISLEAGDKAQARWFPASQPGYDGVFFSGVGDKAEHTKGLFDMVAIIGPDANPTLACGITESGEKNLALSKGIDPTATLSDDTATKADQQYGTLCNKLFGKGDTKTTLTAHPTGTAPTIAPNTLADGGTIPNTKVPVPQGISCAGGNTTKDQTMGGWDCVSPTTDDPAAIFAYFVNALPKAGYTISAESQTKSDAGPVVDHIRFAGPDAGYTSNVLIVGNKVTISVSDPSN